MTDYRANVTREGRYWLVDVEGVGMTQARSLVEAQEMAADLITAMRDVEVAPGDVQLDIDLPGGLVGKVQVARRKSQDAEAAQRHAAQLLRDAAGRLRRDAHLTGKDAAFVLGVSEQRVSQLVAAAKHPLTARRKAG